ncbi:MAG TPA: two-component sensor histidine kinase, partial [Erysipelotrichaceae bacterium]|nr:two-component sensor histidine kinase [Erysipelotrichaceae bacterium]
DILSNKNRHLLVQQEQEIRIAILDERNRIAREIHDHVGHLLSSALLQIGAIQAIQKEDKLKEPLQNLRDTLSQGMDNVRSSVHDLHDDALDLQVTLQRLLKDYSFCDGTLEYDVLHPLSQQTIYHILAIVKESMNNTMK